MICGRSLLVDSFTSLSLHPSFTLSLTRQRDSHPSNYSLFAQITRGETSFKAQLSQLLTEGTSPNPRWLVKFDNKDMKDEEVYEHVFGRKVLSELQLSDKPKAALPDQKETKQDTKLAGLMDDDIAGNTNSSAGSCCSNNNNSSTSDHDDNAEAVAATDRQARSRRREAKITAVKTSKSKSSHSTFKRPTKSTDDCVKIQFLTGTLYLYRGRYRRRAEFVRKV
jgi:hypothetical protein